MTLAPGESLEFLQSCSTQRSLRNAAENAEKTLRAEGCLRLIYYYADAAGRVVPSASSTSTAEL